MLTCSVEIALWRSMIWIKRKSGTRTEPSGTPHNLLTLNQNHYPLIQIDYDLTSRTWTSHNIYLRFRNVLICAVGFYDQHNTTKAILMLIIDHHGLHWLASTKSTEPGHCTTLSSCTLSSFLFLKRHFPRVTFWTVRDLTNQVLRTQLLC